MEAYITIAALNMSCRKGFRFLPLGEMLQRALIMKISQVSSLLCFNAALSADSMFGLDILLFMSSFITVNFNKLIEVRAHIHRDF